MFRTVIKSDQAPVGPVDKHLTKEQSQVPGGTFKAGDDSLTVEPLPSNDNIRSSIIDESELSPELRPMTSLVLDNATDIDGTNEADSGNETPEPQSVHDQQLNNVVGPQANDDQDNAPAPLAQQAIVPLNLDIRSKRGGWNKFGRVVLGALGALVGGAAGGALGVAAGGFFGGSAGAITGLPSGPGAVLTALGGATTFGLVGGVVGVGLGAVAGWKAGAKLADKIADAWNGGRVQAVHLHKATASVQTNRGRTFTPAEVGKLNAVTDHQWRKLLHVPDKKRWIGNEKRVGDSADRQKIREGLVHFVAKHGYVDADKYKKVLIAAANSSNANALDNELARLDRNELSPLNVDHQNGQTHLKRLMTSNDLKGLLGTRDPEGKVTAKKEIKTNLLGMTRNAHYKGILDGLDSYRRKLATMALEDSGKDRFQQGADLRKHLSDLENKVDAYAKRHSDRAGAMNALKQQIARERRLIDDVVAFGDRFAQQIQGQSIAAATNDDLEADPTPIEQQQTWANTTALMAERTGIGGRTSNNEVPLPQGAGFEGGDVNRVDLLKYQDDTIMVFKADKLSEGTYTGWQMDLAGVNLDNPRTGARNVATDIVARHLGVSHLVPRTEYAEHNGQVGTVSALAPGINAAGHKLKFVRPDQHVIANYDPDFRKADGIKEETNLFVKTGGQITDENEINALRQLNEDQLERLGIYGRAPDFYRLNQVVTDPIEKQKLAALSDEQLNQAGFTKVDRAYVSTKQAVPAIDLDSGPVRKELSDAMWLDAITFQTDRHPGNMMVDFNADGSLKGLQLIDNDQGFGKAAKGRALHYHEDASPQQLSVSAEANTLPHISRQTKERLDNLNILHLRRDLAGHLTSDEIEATVDRIKNLQKHAAKLATQNKVLDGDEWATNRGKFPEGDNVRHYARHLKHNRGYVDRQLPPQLIMQSEARLRAPAQNV